MIKIYSHPRSGTHFLEAFVGNNFYPQKDLSLKPIKWGHWSNRIENPAGNEYGRLFGNHALPLDNLYESSPMIYIYRDVRAVVYSLWNTENFLHKDQSGISFSHFIRLKIDWKNTPSNKTNPKENIIEHWYSHVDQWMNFKRNNLLIVRYEELVSFPEKVYHDIRNRFFPLKRVIDTFKTPQIQIIKKPVGLLPNKAKIDAWKEVISEEDNRFILEQLPANCLCLYNG